MQAIANIVLPVFAILLAGYLSGRFGLLGKDSCEALNRFVYYIALPVLLFYAMARVEPADILNWPFIAAFSAGLALSLLIAMLAARLLFRGRLAEVSLFGLAATFSNTGYMGIPLAIAAFGDAGALPAIVATVINAAVLMPITAALVEVDLSRGTGWRRAVQGVASGLARNPLLMAPILGLLWSASGWKLAQPVSAFCEIMQAAAAPSALFAMGLFLVGQTPRRGAGEVGCIVLIKLVVHPALTWWLLTAFFTLDPVWLKVGILQAALPSAALAFVMAQRYGIFAQRASGAVLASTVASVVTLSLLFNWWGDAVLP